MNIVNLLFCPPSTLACHHFSLLVGKARAVFLIRLGIRGICEQKSKKPNEMWQQLKLAMKIGIVFDRKNRTVVSSSKKDN